MNNNNVGVIGLGAMGLGIARSLLRSGFKVHACDAVSYTHLTLPTNREV